MVTKRWLVPLVSLSLALGSMVALQPFVVTQANAAVTWNQVPGLSAVWHAQWPATSGRSGLQNEWSRSDLYFDTTPDGEDPIAIGAQRLVVDRAVFTGTYPDETLTDREPFLSIKSATGSTGTLSLVQVSTMGVGPKRNDDGTVDRNTLVAYFWNYAAGDGGGVPGGTATNCPTGTKHVFRIASGETKIDYACMPLPRQSDSTGGEVDQLTGKVYIQGGTNIAIDTQGRTAATAANTSAFTVSIWDPADNSVVSSAGPSSSTNYEIQPGSAEERVKFKATNTCINQGGDPATTVAPCAGSYSPNTTSDMALDASGNIYMAAAADAEHIVLIRITPTRNSAGKITDASSNSGVGDAGAWKYYVVSHITAQGSGKTWGASGGGMVGSAFYKGSLYVGGYRAMNGCTANKSVLKADPLSNLGTPVCLATAMISRTVNNPPGNTNAGSATNPVDDFASAQTAGVIEGRVYEDANANGVIESNERTGVAGQKIHLYSEENKYLAEATTDTTGSYYFLVYTGEEGEPVNYSVRLVQPHINKGTADSPLYVNAIQTWANGGRYVDTNANGVTEPDETYPDDPTNGIYLNDAKPNCWLGDDESMVNTQTGGRCYGAKNPYDSPDKRSTDTIGGQANPDDWSIYTTVTVLTSADVADADFGISTATGEWGDAQSPIKSTLAQSGPYHINIPDIDAEHTGAWVKLGDEIKQQADGVNDTASNSSAHADDGVFLVIPTPTGENTTSLVNAQDQVMAYGAQYKFQANGEISKPIDGAERIVTDVEVKSWISGAAASATTPGALQTSGTQPLSGSLTATNGANTKGELVGSNWTAPSGTTFGPAVLRVNASVNDQINSSDNSTWQYAAQYEATGTGSTTGNNNAWVTTGEIEDYRMYYATGVVRIGLKTIGGQKTQTFSVTGPLVNTSPFDGSNNTSDSVTTTQANQTKVSTKAHPLTSVTTAITITPTSVAAPWQYDPTQSKCFNTATGADFEANITSTGVTLPNGVTSAVKDVTCVLAVTKAPDPAKSEFVIDTDTKKVGENITGTVTVRDSTGAALPDQVVTFSTDGSDLSLSATTCTTGDGEGGTVLGQCSVTVTSNKAGTYTDAFHAKVPNASGTPTDVGGNGDGTKASPKTVKFTADKADPEKSYFEITPTAASQAAGTNYTIKVTAIDSYGNKVAGAEPEFSSTEPSVSFSALKCTTNDSGECTVTFTSTVAGGPYQVSGKIDKDGTLTDIAGDGDSAKASPQSKSFTSGPIDQSKSTLSIDPSSTAVGSDAVATVTLQDQYGNPITGKTQSDLGLSPESGLTLKNDFADHNDGTYTISVTSTVPETYTLTSSATGDSADVTFTPSTLGSASKSVLTVTPAATSQSVGELYKLEATIYDGIGTANGGKGNPVNGALVTFSSSPTDAGTRGFTPSVGTCTTGTDGKCSVDFTSSLPGTYELHAKIDDRDQAGNPSTDIGGSPVSKTFTTGPIDQSQSSLTVDDTAAVGDNAAVVVTLRDSFGNPVSGLTQTQLQLSASPSGSSFGTFTEGTGANAGVYTGTITSTTVAEYTVSAKPSPLTTALTDTVKFTTIPADWAKSELTITPAGPLEVGTAAGNSYTLTVTARDSYGNLAPDTPVNFSITPAPSPTMGPTLSASSCTTGPDGTCTVTVYSKKAGTFDLHAKIGSNDVGGNGNSSKASPQPRTWNAKSTPSPDYSELTLSPKTIEAGSSTVATITLGDEYGNPITGYTKTDMVLSATPTGPTFANDFADNGDGTYTVTVNNLTKAGTTTIKASPFDSGFVSDTVTVKAKSTNWNATWVADPGTVAVGVYKKVTLTVTDEYENPIQGLTLSDFSSPNNWDGMTRKAGTPDLTTGQEEGKYYWELAGTAINDYRPQISITTALPSAITKETTIRVEGSPVGSVELAIAYPAGRDNAVVSSASQAGTGDYGITVTATVVGQGGEALNNFTASDFTFTASTAPYGPTAWKSPKQDIDPNKDWLIKALSFTNNGDGTYTWKVASNRSGIYDAAVEIGGKTSTPVDAKFVPDLPSNPGGVTLVICPSSTVCADNNMDVVEAYQNQAYAFVEVTDDFGNLVELDDETTTGVNEANTTINAGLSSSPTGVAVTTGAQWTAPRDAYGNRTGPYRTTLTGATNVEYTVSVAITGVVGSDRVKFKTTGVANAELTLSETEHAVCAEVSGECVGATLKVSDSSNNPITGLTAADITLSSNPEGVKVNTKDAVWAESSPGTYVATLWATKAANYYVKANVQGTDSNQVPIKFKAGTVCQAGVDPDCPAEDVDNDHRTRLEITTNDAKANSSERDKITAKLFDAFGNPVEGVQVRSCASGCTGVTVTTSPIPNTDSAGSTAIEYTSTTKGEKSVTVEYSQDGGATWQQVLFVPQSGTTPPATWTSSPATINFTIGEPSASKSTLSVNPTSQVAGSNVDVTYTVKDSNDTPITGLTAADFTTTGAYQSGADAGVTPSSISATPGTFVEVGNGVYTWQMTSRQKGTFKLTGVVKGVTLTQQPTVTFTEGEICITNCDPVDPNNKTRAVVTKNDQKANGTATDEVTVYAYDYNGNKVSGATVLAERDGNTALTPDPVNGTTVNGEYVIKWTSTQAGVFKATIKLNGQTGFEGWAPSNITFQPLDDPSATKSTLTSSPAGPIVVGQSYTLTATVADAFGNPLNGQSVAFSSSDPVTFDYANCVTVGGTCSVTVTSTQAGTWTVSGKINIAGTATEIQGSSDAEKSPKQLEWTAGSPCVPGVDPNCTTDPTKQTRLEEIRNDQEANDTAKDAWKLYVTDMYGNPVSGAAWATTTSNSALHIVTASGTTGADGTATLEYTSGQPGSYQANVTAAGKAVPQSPITARFGAGNVASITASASAGPVAVDQNYTLSIHAEDASGHAVKDVTGTFQLPSDLHVVGGGSASCLTSDSGDCSIQVTTTKAGDYSVNVQSTPAATGSPLALTFTAGAVDASHTLTTVAHDNAKPGGVETNVITVTVRDKYDNPIQGATVTSTSGSSHMTQYGTIAPTGADGITQIAYTADDEGDFTAAITAGGVTPTGGAGSPVTLHFRYAQLDVTKSSWSVAPAGPLVVGTDAANTYTLTVTARDADNQPVGNAGVTFSVDQTGPTWVDGKFQCDTNAAGQCSVQIYSTVAGTFALSAVASTGTLGSAKSVVWSADEVCDKDCTPKPGVDPEHRTRYEVTVNDQVADGSSADVIKVYAFDQWGNPVPNQPVGASGPSDVRIQTGIAPTNADGTSTVNIYSTEVGEFDIDLWIGPESDKKIPPNLPAKVKFKAGPVCTESMANCPKDDVPNEQRTRLEITTDNATADGVATDVITVYTFDADGHPVATQVQSTSDSDVVIGTIADTSATTGSTTITYKSTKAGEHTVHVQVMSEGAWADVVFKPQPGTTPPDNVTSSPAKIHFVAGDPSAANSNLSASPTTQTVGDVVKVSLTIKDANLNPVTNLVESDFQITGAYISGGEAGTPDIAAKVGTFVNNGDGAYTFDITSEKVGQFNLTGVAKGVTLNQHPAITFTAGGVCVTNCQGDKKTHADITKNDALANGTDTDEVTVYAYDTYGNPVPGASVVVTRDGNTVLTPATQTVTTGTDGTAVVKWTATTSGTYSAAITVDGLNGFPGWAPSTIRFSPVVDVDLSKSKFEQTPAGPLKAGETYTLTATIRNAYEDKLEGVSVSFTASDPAVTIDSGCQTNDDGVCTVTATTTKAGSYTVNARVNVSGTQQDITGDGSAAQKSPKTLVWEAGAACVPPVDTGCDATNHSRVEPVKQIATANGTDKATAKVYVLDRYGNPISGAAWATSTTASALNIVTASGTTGADGTSLLEYTSTVAGTYEAAVTLAGKQAEGSPFKPTFEPDPGTTGVTASKSPTTAIEVEQNFTIGIHAQDAGGNPVANKAAQFAIPADVTASATTCSTDAFGNCSIQVTSTKAGTYQIGVQTNPAAVPATLEVEFTAGAVDASKTKTEYVQDGVKPDGTAQDVVRVIAHDRFDNPVSGAAVASTVSSSSVTVGSPIAATDANGITQISYTATAEGEFPAAITVAGVTPAGGLGSPVKLHFQWTQIDPSKSSWTVTPASPIKVGEGAESTYTLTVTARDADNEPAGGGNVNFAISPDGPVWGASGYSCTTNSAGTCSVTVSSTKSGTYSLTATVAAGPIGSAKSVAWSAEEVCVPVNGTGCSNDPALQTRYAVTLDNQVADNIAADEITVYAFDKYGNPVPNQPVGASTTDSALRIGSGIAATGEDGTTRVLLYSKVKGEHTVDSIWIGTESNKKILPNLPAKVNFTDGGPCTDPSCQNDEVPNDKRTRLEITTDNSPEDGVTPDVITVYVFDGNGNASATAVRSTAPAGVTVGSPIANTSGTTGSTTVQYTSSVAGEYQVVVEIQAAGAWVPVVFTPKTGTTPPANYTSSPATIHFTDTTAPDAPESAHQDRDEDGKPVVTNSPDNDAQPGDTIVVTWPDGSTSETTVGDDGSWSVEIPEDMEDGDAKVVAKDPSGNESAPVEVPIDVTAPDAPESAHQDRDTAGNPVVTNKPDNDAEPGSTITVTWPDGTTSTTTVADDGSWSVPIPDSVEDGTATVTATDEAGNVSDPVTVPLDTTGPDAPESAHQDVDADGKQVVTNEPDNDAEPGDTIVVTWPDGSTSETVVGEDGSWSVEIPEGMEDGDATVVAKDEEGNESAPVTVPIDTTAPDAPESAHQDRDAGGNPVVTNKPDNDAEPGSTIKVTWPDGTESETTVADDGSWSVPIPPGMEDGDAVVTAVDEFGNESDPIEVPIDVTAPDAPESAHQSRDTAGNPVVTNKPDNDAEPGSTITVTWPDGTTSTTTVADDGSWSVPIPESVEDGTATVTATDEAGNVSDPVDVPLNVSAPAAPESAHQDRDEDGNPVVTNSPDNDAVPGDTIVVTWPDGSTTETVVGEDGSWSVEIPEGMEDGEATVVAKDPDGNTSDPVTVDIDTTAPDAPESAHQDRTDEGTPVVTNKPDNDAEPGSTIKVVWPDGSESTATVADDGSFSVPIPEGMEDGDATVTAIDAAGNESDPVEVPIDVTAPTTPVINTANATEVSGTGEPGSTITVTYPAGSNPASAETTVGPDGKWKIDLPALVDGKSPVKSGNITAVASDEAGNESTSQPKWLDTEVPPPPVITKAENSLIEGHIDPEKNDPGTIVRVTFPDGSVADVTPDADGNWNVAIPADADKAGPINAVAIDPAGNVSAPATGVRDYPGPGENPANPEAHQDGDKVVGCNATPGNEIIVTFPDGETDTTEVGEDGCWSVDIPADTPSGDTTVVQKDPDTGKESDPTHVTIDTDPPEDPTSAHQDRVNDQPVVTNDDNDAEPGATVVVTWPDGTKSETTVNPDGSWSVPIPDNTDGTAKVVVKDPQGNTSGEVSVPVDSRPPAAPESAHQDGPKVTNSPDNDSEPGDTITVTWPDGSTSTTTVADDGSWSVGIPGGMDSGTAQVTETDPKGNKSDPVSVPLDTVPPSAPDSAHQDRDSSGNPVVTNKPDNDAAAGDKIIVTWPDGTKSETTVGEDGSWSVPIPDGMADGNATVVAKDPAGNTSAEVKVPIDTTAPNAPSDARQVGDQVTNKPANSDTPGDKIIVTWPDGTKSETTVADDGSWSVTIPPGVDAGQATVVAQDAAGNTSAPVTVDLYKPMGLMGAEVYVATQQGQPVLVPVLEAVSGGKAPIYMAAYTEPSNGAITSTQAAGFALLPDGTVTMTYVPNATFVGVEHFTVTVQDAAGATLEVPVTVEVFQERDSDDCEDDDTCGSDSSTGGELAQTWGWLAMELAMAGLVLLLLAVASRRRRAQG
jgi:hypothetical protein